MKYHNTPTACQAGHKHPSILEANYCDQLALLVKAGEIKSYKTQVKYGLCVNNNHVCDHIVDFEVETKDGKKEIHEAKGFQTAVWRLKFNLFRAIYPGTEYHIISQNNKNTGDRRRKRARTFR